MVDPAANTNEPFLSSIDILNAAGSVWIKTDKQRAAMTIAAKDTVILPKVKDAGKSRIENGQRIQIMHNGVKVLKDGYQGQWMSEIIAALKGNHEPQEEFVFYEVLKRVRKNGTIMELGSWWSYYSIWFTREVSGRAFCCEPDPENLKVGQANATLNDLKIGKDITFINAAIGLNDGHEVSFTTEAKEVVTVPVRSVDGLIKENNIERLEILHMDIQGFELDGLAGALKSIKEGKVRFLFVSTHHYAISGDPLIHKKCLDFIKKNGGHIISSHTILESSSGDGLIVASFDPKDKDFLVKTSTQKTDDSLFRSAEEDTAILWNSYNQLVEYITRIESVGAEPQTTKKPTRRNYIKRLIKGS